MATGGFVIHVKDEAVLRELVELVRGDLANGYSEVMAAIGVRSQQVWLARTKEGPALMVVLEADDPEAAVRAFIEIDTPPIGIWLRDVAVNATEITKALERPMEMLLSIESERSIEVDVKQP